MPHLEPERRIEAVQVRNRIRDIGRTAYSARRPIAGLEACVTGTGLGPASPPKRGWKPFAPGTRWGGFDQTTWFRARLRIPAEMRGHCVVALVRPGGESLAYLDGQPFQGLDNNRDELFLTDKARGGERFELVTESVPSVRFDTFHHFEYADLAVFHPDIWEFYWDCQVAYEVWETLDADSGSRLRLMELLNDVVRSVEPDHAGRPRYHESVARARRLLQRGLEAFPAGPDTGRLTLAGHSHIDTAWLWPLRETRRKCGRTFSTMLNLMDRYREFHFSCSQPAQYEWIKRDYPDVYRRIRARVKEGRWEPCGAMWVESDCNVPLGESLVRQFLYGNRFFQDEFGRRSPIAWLPDVFGFTWSLPQIMAKAGIEAFVTTKIDWGAFSKFPYSYFLWEGADGTRIPALMPPLNYNGNPLPDQCIKQWKLFRQKDRADEVPFSFGWGDGGGGTTMNMIEHVRRQKDIVGLPKCEFGRITDSIRRMNDRCDMSRLPVWNDELYLELHRGCQTTQARAKRDNRKAELLLRDTELLASLAMLEGATYDIDALRKAWKIVLTNQFHDILPGSSITEVYAQTALDYARARGMAEVVRRSALDRLAAHIDTAGDGAPLLVINTCSWMRSEVVEARAPLPRGPFAVIGPNGEPVAHQRVAADRLLFHAETVPPLGHAVYRVVAEKRGVPSGPEAVTARRNLLENEFLRVKLDGDGRLTSLYDKVERREALPKGTRGNDLQLFEDRPFAHDAWDIDHNFDEKPLPLGSAERIEVLEDGPLRGVVRVVRRTEKSVITQDITLHAGSPRVEFVTHVDWHEKRTLLKVAFPVDVRASRAAYEIQFAAIERPTHRNTEADAGRFEVTGLRWADLSEGDYGVSLLNDCKYGHDVKNNVLRLSLLRSPVEPDPTADEGEHDFTYAVYPHAGDWRNGTVQQGIELNTPLVVESVAASKGRRPPVDAFAVVDAENVVIDTVKRAEDSKAIIVRLYEAYGQRGDATITFGRTPAKITECDLMEENDTPAPLRGASVRLYMKPFEIRTLKVLFDG